MVRPGVKLRLEALGSVASLERIDVADQQIRRLLQLHAKRGVEHVGACHALVQPAPFRPELLARPGQKRDHVVADFGFDRFRCTGTLLPAEGGDCADAELANAKSDIERIRISCPRSEPRSRLGAISRSIRAWPLAHCVSISPLALLRPPVTFAVAPTRDDDAPRARRWPTPSG